MPTDQPSSTTLKDVIETVSRSDARIHVLDPTLALAPVRAHPPLFIPEQHAYYELAICFAGAMSLVGQATTIQLQSGDAVIVKPGAWHYESYCRKSQPYRMCWVVATPHLINCVLTHFHRGSFVTATYGGRPRLDEIDALESLAREITEQALHWRVKARTLLMALLVDLDRRLHGDSSVVCVDQLDPVRKLFRIAQARFREPPQLRSLAREVGLSANHLSRRFRLTAGVTFKDYLNAIRIHHAQRLLRSGWSVKRTAGECGFQDVYYFSRVFKLRCHVSPGQFARQATPPP